MFNTGHLSINDNKFTTLASSGWGKPIYFPTETLTSIIVRNNTLTVGGSAGGTVQGLIEVAGVAAEDIGGNFSDDVTKTVSITGAASGNAKFTSVTSGTGTAAAGTWTGANFVNVTYSGQAAITITTRTGTQMAADFAGIQTGQTFLLLITNKNTGTLTLTAASGVTITGQATMLTNTSSLLLGTYTAANTFVFQRLMNGVP